MLQNSLSVNSLKARQLSATAIGIVSSDTRRTKSPSGRRKSTSCRLTKAFTAVQAFTRPCSSSLSSSRSTRTPPPGTVSTQTSGMVGTRSPAARCCRCPTPTRHQDHAQDEDHEEAHGRPLHVLSRRRSEVYGWCHHSEPGYACIREWERSVRVGGRAATLCRPRTSSSSPAPNPILSIGPWSLGSTMPGRRIRHDDDRIRARPR